MLNYKTLILILLCGVISDSCTKHEALPDLEPIPPVPPKFYPYGGNSMVLLDSTRIVQNGSTGFYSLNCFVSIKSAVLAQYATRYNKINVYNGSTLYGPLNYPLKSFGKLATSGQVYYYHFTMVDTAGFESKSSPIYTVTIP